MQGGIDAPRGFVLSCVETQREPAAEDIDGLIDRWIDDWLVINKRTNMDVTLSELLAAFMESPLVLWVSGSCTRKHSCARMMHELMTSDSFSLSLLSFSQLGDS